MSAKIEIKLDGPKGSSAERHRFTADDLVDLVFNLQKAVRRLASEMAGKESSDLRKVAKAFREACTLEFGPIREGSAKLSAELAPIIDQELDLFPTLKTVPSKALNEILDIIKMANSGDLTGYSILLFEDLKNLGKAVSREESSYLTISVYNGSKPKQAKYTRNTYRYFSGITEIPEKTESPLPLTGKLMEIDWSKHSGRLETEDVKIPISFPEELDIRLGKRGKSEVNLSGIAELDKEGNIKKYKVESLLGGKQQRLFYDRSVEGKSEHLGELFTVNYIKYRSREINLKKHLNCTLRIEEGLWIISNDSLGLTAFGEDFDTAWQDFAEDFFFLLDEYLNEEDDNLYKNAKELKKRLMELTTNEPDV